MREGRRKYGIQRKKIRGPEGGTRKLCGEKPQSCGEQDRSSKECRIQVRRKSRDKIRIPERKRGRILSRKNGYRIGYDIRK